MTASANGVLVLAVGEVQLVATNGGFGLAASGVLVSAVSGGLVLAVNGVLVFGVADDSELDWSSRSLATEATALGVNTRSLLLFI